MATEKKRRAILNAAENLFLSRRFDQVTLDEVCRKAGVGKGTIYRYFDSKEELLAEVILSGMDDLYEMMKLKTESARSPDGKLLATAKALQGFHRRHSTLFRSLHAEWLRGVRGAATCTRR